MEDLSNLLGDSPEFLDGVPRVSQAFEKGFFALECESVLKGRRPSSIDDSAGEDPDVDLEVESDDDEGSWLHLGKTSASAIAYYLTDNERFAPPKKRSKIIRRTYRMIALVSTNPEELYTRKIDAEEYGEAIMLAQHYRLDTDPVYERQWRKSNKSVAAIHDYLGKIKRRDSVINECLNTIPPDIDAARELLEYGLSGTDLESLIVMIDVDSGEFVQSARGRDAADWFDEGGEADAEEVATKKAEKDRVERLRLISKVNWQSLSLAQKDLIAARLKFLYYLDILSIYEEVLGGGQFAADRFNPEVYSRMRSLSPIENCLYSARNSDPITVSVFFSMAFSKVILPHWLPILSAFPETTKASQFQEVLPALSMDGQPVPWIVGEARELDWSEQALSLKWSGHSNEHDSCVLYAEDPALKAFCVSPLTPQLIKEWYEWRAKVITQKTNLPELGLELLQQGLERNVPISLSLINDLRTMDALVYDVQLEVDLGAFEKLDTMGQIDLLLSRRDDLMQSIRSLLVPYLYRMDDARPGDFFNVLYKFCLHQAKTDLSIPVMVVENSGYKTNAAILQDPRQIINLGIDCCYALESGAQIELIERMSRCIVEYFEFAPGRLRLDFIQSHRLDIEQFKRFLQHLDIVKILSRHNVRKSMQLFKESIQERNVMQKIFESVTCQAESTKPSLDQDGWRSVLRDLQRLQKLIPVVPIQRVFYMFCESLLSSGSSANIDLAGDVLKTMMEPDDQVSLVVTAWTHYFSTSANLHDPNIELAKHCLCLVKSNSKEITDCSDLIASLQSLEDFGLADVHPIAVLKSKDRLEFVTKALNTKPQAYKNAQRLMKLASLLKVENLDSLEGLIWTLVAKKALDVEDFSTCQTACNNIVQCGYTKGWEVCFALGVKAEFNDLEKCMDLLSFAATHCDQDNIENVVLSLLKLEQKLLHANMASKAGMNEGLEFVDVSDDVEEIFEDSVEEIRSRELSPFPSVVNVKNTILNVTSLSSQYLMDNEISRRVLDSTSSFIKQIARQETLDSMTEEDMGKTFESIRFPAFYSSLFVGEDVSESQVHPNYKSFSMPRITNNLSVATQQALRSQMLSGVLLDLIPSDEPVDREISQELLTELIPLVASNDLHQGLGILLAFSNKDELESLLKSVPQTVPSLNYIIVFLCLMIHAKLEKTEEREKLFNRSPMNLLVTALQGEKVEPEYQILSEFLEIATDHNQAGLLSSLAGDVDTTRFTRDQQYKEDTILGLARFLEDDNWKFTCALAKRYQVESWIVAATHLEAIFVDNEDTRRIKQMLGERDLSTVLQEDPERWKEWSKEKIFPLLDGNALDKLDLYFQIMYDITKDAAYMDHKEAVKLLNESQVPLDYIRLLAGDLSVLDFVDPSELDVIAKVADKIPRTGETNLNISQIYLTFAKKEFLHHGEVHQNWIEAFSHCQDFLEKMDSDSFKDFVTFLFLSDQCLTRVPRMSKNRIIKKSVKFAEIKVAEKAKGNWLELQSWLEHLKGHLDCLNSKITEDIVKSMEREEARVVDKFEQTGGDENKILDLFVDLIASGTSEESLSKLIAVWKQDDSATESGFSQIFVHCAEALRSEAVEDSHKLCICIQRLLDEFTCSFDNVRSLLTPLCTLETLSVSDRLVFVQLLKQTETAEEGEQEEFDSSVLSELYQVQESLQAVILDVQISERDLESMESKLEMFNRVSSQCQTITQLEELAKFATEYFEDAAEVGGRCVYSLVEKSIQSESDQSETVQFILAHQDMLSESDVEGLLGMCQDSKRELFVKLVLKLKLSDRFHLAGKILCELDSVEDATLKYVIEAGLGADLATSALYSRVTEVAMAEDLALPLIQQLKQGGHTPLAYALQLISSGLPASLRTMAAFRLK